MEGKNEELEAIKQIGEQVKAFKDSLAGKSDKTEIAEMLKTLDTLKANADKIDKMDLTKQLADIATQLKEMQEDVNTVRNASPKGENRKAQLIEEIKKFREEIKGIAKGSTNKELVLKALVLRSAITNNELDVDLPGVGQLATRKLSLYDLFPKFPVGKGTHAGVIRYYDWDEATIVRAAAAVAEGAAFPESTAKFKKGSISLQKIGDTLPVSEEFLEDEAMFAAELDFFLQTNVALKVDTDLYSATGAGNTITGLLASIDAYTPVASGILDPSLYDLIVKVSEIITSVGGSKYMPDFVAMNKRTINTMRLKKNLNGDYVVPPFATRDGMQIDSMAVVESNVFANDVMVVGDSRFGRIYEMDGVEITRGLTGAQFVEDEMTIKARKRLAFLIRAADKGGFLKVTSIATAINELGAAEA